MLVAAVVGLTRAVVGLTRAARAWLVRRVRGRARWLAGGTAAALLVVVGAAAVAVREAPGDAAALSASRVAAATDRPEPPTRPTALERSDERGATAAAAYVLELEPYGLLSGDRRDFEALCSAQSGWCRDKLASMRLVASGTVRYDGCAAHVEAVRTTPTQAPDTFVVTVAQRQAPCVRHDLTTTGTPGAVDVYGGNEEPDALPDLIDVTVRHGPSGWRVVRASLA